MNGPHRLIGRAPGGSSDSGRGQSDVCARLLANAPRHGESGGLANRAMLLQGRLRDAKSTDLGIIGVANSGLNEPG